MVETTQSVTQTSEYRLDLSWYHENGSCSEHCAEPPNCRLDSSHAGTLRGGLRVRRSALNRETPGSSPGPAATSTGLRAATFHSAPRFSTPGGPAVDC